MATGALVLGIISLAISVLGGPADLGWIGSICGIVAIVLGALSMKGPQKGYAKAGLICGIIALTWGIVVTIACVACVGAGLGALASFVNY